MQRREFIRNSILVGLSTSAIPTYAFETNDVHEKLVILHTNDTHSRIDPFDSGEYQGMGGVSARKTMIDDVRSREKNVLLLDAGDIFQGTPYFNLFHGELEIKAMSMLGYDAGTLGNHDFDMGMENFALQNRYANFPFINSNYISTDTPLQGILHPYKIMRRGAIKVGILGLGIDLNGLVPFENYQGLLYQNPITQATKYANILKHDERCDIIIALSHLGYDYKDKKTISDIRIAQEVDNIDIILGGHTHTFLQCPKLIQKSEKKIVIVNQVGFAGINLGRIDVYFDKEKNKIEKNESLLLKCQNK